VRLDGEKGEGQIRRGVDMNSEGMDSEGVGMSSSSSQRNGVFSGNSAYLLLISLIISLSTYGVAAG